MMKRFLSVLLAVCMGAGVLCAGVISVHAEDSRHDIIAIVEEYNKIHGGEGSLVATITGNKEVTITGQVIGVTQALVIQSGEFYTGGILIKLNAIIEADSENPPDALIHDYIPGVIEVIGGVLRSPAYALESGDTTNIFVVSGGAVYAGISASTLVIKGGIVEFTVDFWDTLLASYPTANVSAGSLSISKGATVRLAHINVPEDANYQLLTAHVAFIDFDADILFEGFEPRIMILANASFTEFTAQNEAELWQDFTLLPGQTLTVPENTTLYVTYGDLILNGGTLVIDGHIILEESDEYGYCGKLEIIYGTITGKNAGDLAGTYEKAPDPPVPPWWSTLSPILQFLLRWFCFGWIWMK